MLDGLNDAQKEAVLHEQGPLLVFASAGSGKTRVVTRRIQHLVEVRDVPPERVLAMTFTNKAAREMRDRLAAAIGTNAAKKVVMGTFHAVCAGFLRRYPELSGRTAKFVIYDEDEQRTVLKGIIEEAEEESKAKGFEMDTVFDVDIVADRIEKEKRKGRLPEALRPKADEPGEIAFKDMWTTYERKMVMLDAADFADLVLHGTRLCESDTTAGKAMRARFDHVLADEWQDTDEIQARLVAALACTTRNLCVVGDDFQAIFGWRGAELRIIREFHKAYADAKIVKLELNYRSRPAIVDHAMRVIQLDTGHIDKGMVATKKQGEMVTVAALMDERAEAAFVADNVQALVAAGSSLGDCAVLYRLNHLSRPIEEALRLRDIRYRIVGGLKFFQRAIIKDAIAYLRLCLKPDSDIDLHRIVDTPPCGVGGGTMTRLRRRATMRESSLFRVLNEVACLPETRAKERLALSDLATRIEQMRADVGEKPVGEAMPIVLGKSGLARWLQTQLNDYRFGAKPSAKKAEEVQNRIDHIAELVTDAARWQQRREADEEDVDIGSYLERVALLSSDDSDDTKGVVLSTCHAAKGREWDNVFLVAMEEGIMPAYPDRKTPDEMNEEVRVAYVGMTRARERLWLTRAETRWSLGKTVQNAPSRFLDPDAFVAEKKE